MKLTKITEIYMRALPRAFRAISGGMAVSILASSLVGCAATNALMGGNSRKEALAEIAWEFAENGVVIEIEADPLLNEYNGEAHTLLLGVYQMEDSAAFYKLSADSMLLAKALESGKAGDSFTHFVRYVIAPGQKIIMAVNRAQKSKFVGIAAGYYQMDGANSTRLFQIPLTVASDGLITKSYKAAPAILNLRLSLGADSIVNAQRLNRDRSEKPKLEAVPLDGGGKELKLLVEDVKTTMDLDNAVRKLDK